MGRMLDTMRQAESVAPPAEEPVALHAVGEETDAQAPEEGEEVPFIEVGPRRSMEASPSVLACAPPAPRPLTPAPSAAPGLSEGPRHVAFRPVPVRPRLAPELVAFHDPEGPAGVQYRELLTALLAAPRERSSPPPKLLLFTAAQPGAGTTTILLNVAISAAREGRWRVAVVDANPRRPAVAARLGLAETPGMCEVLARSVALEEALREAAPTGLTVLTAGGPGSNAGPRFAAETARSVLHRLRQRFDLVFVDGPPWDGRTEAAALGGACDAVYVVLAEYEAETPQTDRLLQTIPAQGARFAGCILAGR